MGDTAYKREDLLRAGIPQFLLQKNEKERILMEDQKELLAKQMEFLSKAVKPGGGPPSVTIRKNL